MVKLFTEKCAVRHEPENVQCNICGEAVAKNEWGYLMDYVSLSKAWGFHSPYDGEAHDIDMCVECYGNWVDAFEIPPARKELNELMTV